MVVGNPRAFNAYMCADPQVVSSRARHPTLEPRPLRRGGRRVGGGGARQLVAVQLEKRAVLEQHVGVPDPDHRIEKQHLELDLLAADRHVLGHVVVPLVRGLGWQWGTRDICQSKRCIS